MADETPTSDRPVFNPAVLEAIADERERLGDRPHWSFEEWANGFLSALGLHSQSVGVIGSAGRRQAYLGTIAMEERRALTDDEKQVIETLVAQAQAESMNARMFLIRLMAMGFDWMEAHEAEEIELS